MQEEIKSSGSRSGGKRFNLLAKIHPASLILASAGLILSGIGMLSEKKNIDVFSYLLFYMPILWIFWNICVCTLKGPGYFIKLIFLWLVIDLSILFLYIMLSKDVPNWGKSRGIEVVMAVTYLPIIIPFGFFINVIPENADSILQIFFKALIHFTGPSLGEALTIWLEMSFIAALQSSCVIGLVRWWSRRKKT